MASTSGYLPNTRSGFLLSEEETQTLNSVPYGTIMTDQGSVNATTILQHPLRWVVPHSEPSVEAAYVGILHPPVAVSEEVAKQLAALSNQAGLNATMGMHKDPGYLSLQEMLINQNIEQAQWEVVLDQGPNAIRQLFSFDRTKNEARLIHRIPFTHISQVYMCTKVKKSVAMIADLIITLSSYFNRKSMFFFVSFFWIVNILAPAATTHFQHTLPELFQRNPAGRNHEATGEHPARRR